MKTYSVKEIADMLKTNPETVRRWIRLGKLEAIQSSRKEGNVVTEQSFNKFLKSMPKYAGIAASTVGLLGGFSLPVLAVVSAILTHQYMMEDKIKNAQVSISELSKLIEAHINNSKKTILSKKEEIKKINLEIEAEKHNIQDMEELLKNLTSQKIKEQN